MLIFTLSRYVIVVCLLRLLNLDCRRNTARVRFRCDRVVRITLGFEFVKLLILFGRVLRFQIRDLKFLVVYYASQMSLWLIVVFNFVKLIFFVFFFFVFVTVFFVRSLLRLLVLFYRSIIVWVNWLISNNSLGL
jgi:hypothetical protein